MFPSTSHLFYGAAIVNFMTIPKHFMVGQNYVSKSIAAIPSTPELAKGKSIAFTAWDMCNGALFVFGILNYKWGKFGGPETFEEKLALWAITITGTLVGITYYKAKVYVGLGCLWVAPWLSTIAMLLSN